MLSKIGMKGWKQRAMGLMMLALLALFAVAANASVPAAVVTSQTTVTSTGLGGSEVSVALDACGNLYTIQQGSGNVYETPSGGGTAVQVLSGTAYNWSSDISMYINPAGTYAYVSEGFGGNGSQVGRIPIVNCALQVGSFTYIANTYGNGWWAPGAITDDTAGDIFFSSWNGNGIIKTSADQKTQTVLLNGLSGLPNALAVDLNGNLFYALNNSIYELTYSKGAYATTPVQFSTGYTSLVGLTLDKMGNLYVTDQGNSGWYALNGWSNAMYVASTISVIPYENSALNLADQYTVAQGTSASDPIEAPSQVAVDAQGNLYSVLNTVISELMVNHLNFGSVAVAGNAAASLHVQFDAATTPASYRVVSNHGAVASATGGTCAAKAYTAGSSCVLNTTFAPTQPGAEYGSLQLLDASHNVLAASYLSGTGLGAGITLDSGTVSAVGSGFTTPQSIVVTGSGGYVVDSGLNKVLYFATPTSTPVSIGTGLLKPQGVAVDGAGNLFIADTGNNQIVEVPFLNGALSSAAQTTLVTAYVLDSASKKVPTPIAGAVLNAPAGITVDGQGNLVISDTGNNRIVYLPFTGSWNTANASVLGSGFIAPLATTVDASGNLYVADSGAGLIYKLPNPYSSATPQLAAVGYNNPSALATDASGSLFVVNQGANSILRIPNISGSLDPNSAIEVGFGVAAPYGMALDPSGNLYVTDATHSTAYQLNRVSTTESFGDWVLNVPSGALPVKVENEGNQTLNFGSTFYTASGNTGDFSLGTPSGAEPACANSGTVAPGAVCELDAIFTPAAAGSRTDTLVLASNAKNAGAPQVVLSGNGLASSATTTALVVSTPSGTPYFGQAITLTATITSSGGTPTGSVQLLVDGVITGVATLSSSSTATFSLPMGLTGGNHSLIAVYLGSSTFDGSSSAALKVTVSAAATTTTLLITPPYVSPNSVVFGGSVSYAATINFAGVGIPTGTVTFTLGTTTVGTASVLPIAGGLFQASISTTSLPLGTDVVKATYSGDANYVGSVSGTQTVIVESAPLEIMTASGSTITASANNSTSVTFTGISYGGWNGLVGFVCDPATLPAHTVCVFSPGQITLLASANGGALNPPGVVTLSLAINQDPQTPTASTTIWWVAGFTGLLLLFARRRMKKLVHSTGLNAFLLVVAFGALTTCFLGLSACTSGVAFATPKGTQAVTVYAYSDPFVSGTGGSTVVCTTTSTAPCSKTSFTVNVTVQ